MIECLENEIVLIFFQNFDDDQIEMTSTGENSTMIEYDEDTSNISMKFIFFISIIINLNYHR